MGDALRSSRSQMKNRGSHSTTIDPGVCDLEKRREVFTTRVAPLPRLKLGFALSPQGSLLAMQTDSLLRVWRIGGCVVLPSSGREVRRHTGFSRRR